MQKTAKPFLKWAGGKTQLLSEIDSVIPSFVKELHEVSYIEPFVGGGAVLFHILNNYPNIKNIVINDINKNLITAYSTIKNNVDELVYILKKLELEYKSLIDEDKRKDFFLQQREIFNNSNNIGDIEKSAILIFLNKTCFNGLYRENSKGKFNVPFGKYVNPTICDENNLFTVSSLLQKVTILCGDFEGTIKYAGDRSFYYLDPPYRPVSKTSSFNSYTKEVFDDKEQIRLRDFCNKIIDLKGSILLSNSDSKQKDSNEDFFGTIYQNYNIGRVKAKRSINSKANLRGTLNELLISNL